MTGSHHSAMNRNITACLHDRLHIPSQGSAVQATGSPQITSHSFFHYCCVRVPLQAAETYIRAASSSRRLLRIHCAFDKGISARQGLRPEMSPRELNIGLRRVIDQHDDDDDDQCFMIQ